MTSPDLDKLLSLAEAATNGPWSTGGYTDKPPARYCVHAPDPDHVLCEAYDHRDAAYIAACDPTTIKALGEELRRVNARLDFIAQQVPRWLADLKWGAYKGAMLEDADVRWCLARAKELEKS